MPFLQEWIHKLEEGAWFRYVRISLVCLAAVGLVVWFNARSYHNMKSPEAMDAAQVARNIAEGKGYTTLFIRPFSMHLLQERAKDKLGPAATDPRADSAKLREMHPDLANAPVYPLVLAGLMKILPFHYEINLKHPFWSIPPVRSGNPRQFWRYEPDFLISLFNQFLFFVTVALTFFLTRRLFDRTMAWTSAVLLLGCEQLWRFSTSGLSTMLLLLIFTGLIWCLVLMESAVREAKGGEARLLLLAVAAGALLGLGTLTRYSFGWLVFPLLTFIILFGGARRIVLCLAVAGVFLAALAPWVYRNWNLSGTLFGTAGYATVEGTGSFPANRLGRSLNPDFTQVSVRAFNYKLLNNSRQMLQYELPKLGGSWATPFFLVGLLLGFHNLAIRRLRYLLMGALVTLFIVQALGRTHLSEDAGDIHSENLLVLLVPMVIVYGVSLFFLLLDQMNLLFHKLRYAIIGVFGFVLCLPMIFTFLPPKPTPLVYPPYYPPVIQTTAGWMNENELMMSDVPWAVAWYGQRQCAWLTLDADKEFFAVNDASKPVRALYLTPQTLDNRFLSEWIRPGERSWGSFIIEFIVRRESPKNFPLRVAPTGFLPEQLFVTDWERWKKPGEPSAP